MRIAISSEDQNGLDSSVAQHFGRCPYFILVDLDGHEVRQINVVDNPFYARHEPGQVPAFIHSQKADVMLAGGMGHRAIGFFEQYGIEAATGASGTVRNAIEKYLGGELRGAAPCSDSNEHSHDC